MSRTVTIDVADAREIAAISAAVITDAQLAALGRLRDAVVAEVEPFSRAPQGGLCDCCVCRALG